MCIGTGSIGANSHPSASPRLRSCYEAVLSLSLMNELLLHIQRADLLSAFTSIEMPHLMTIAKMEQNGIGEYLKFKWHLLEADALRRGFFYDLAMSLLRIYFP